MFLSVLKSHYMYKSLFYMALMTFLINEFDYVKVVQPAELRAYTDQEFITGDELG